MEKKILNHVKKRELIYSYLKEIINNNMLEENYEEAASSCQVAASYASECHLGLFTDLELESTLNEISRKTITSTNVKYDGFQKKILHIATTIYDTGGHTRLLKNWINYDITYDNEVLLVEKDAISEAVETLKFLKQKKIKVQFLNEKTLLNRAQKLREICDGFEYIVLHTHPHDVVPVLALTDIKSKVFFMNHADHRFWLGATVADKFLELRKMGQNISINLRGIKEEYTSILPIPLKPIDDCLDREFIRNELKVKPNEVLLFSVASKHKYQPVHDQGISSIFLPLINSNDNLKMLVVGPDKKEKYWGDMYINSGGRIDAIGMKSEVDMYYKAADIYIDSYPISSLTSLLDAAKYGLPIFSINKGAGASDLDDIALDKIDFKYDSFTKLVEAVDIFIKDKSLREDFALDCAKKIEVEHLNPFWCNKLRLILENTKKREDNNISIARNRELSSEFDLPLIYMYFKDKTIDYEFLHILSSNYAIMNKELKLKYFKSFVSFCLSNKKIEARLLPFGMKQKIIKISKKIKLK